MTIGNSLRQTIQRHNNISIGTNHETQNKFHAKYNTRLQNKIHSNGTIKISYNVSMDDIKKILTNINKHIPYINRYITKNSGYIDINYYNNQFILNGTNLNLYSFLSSEFGINILIDIWNDQRNPSYQLTSMEFDNNFKNIVLKEGSNCNICLENISDNIGIMTKCNHTFHYNCLKTWLTKNCHIPSCPCCRINLDIY